LPPRTCWQIIAAAGYATSEKAVAYDNRANVRAGANAEALTDFNQDINLRGASAMWASAPTLTPATDATQLTRGLAVAIAG
jgi:hypothetical protein